MLLQTFTTNAVNRAPAAVLASVRWSAFDKIRREARPKAERDVPPSLQNDLPDPSMIAKSKTGQGIAVHPYNLCNSEFRLGTIRSMMARPRHLYVPPSSLEKRGLATGKKQPSPDGLCSYYQVGLQRLLLHATSESPSKKHFNERSRDATT